MQEFSIELADRINVGLRRDDRSGRDKPGLIKLFNHKPTEFGLRQVSTPAIPSALATAMTSAGITVAYPFPQLFRGKTQSFLLTSTRLYTVSDSYVLTQVSTFDPITRASANISTGSSWQFVDYGDTYLFFNGVCTIAKWKRDSLFGTADTAFVWTDPFVNTGEGFGGRLIFGGFTDGVWRDEWMSFWEGIDVSNQYDQSVAIANNSVMWTSVGGSEFWWLADPSIILNDRNAIIQMLKKNQFGWKELDHRGSVLNVKTLKKNEEVLVYGENGITRMTPTTTPQGSPTFGFEQIEEFGLISRSAIVKARGRHIFVSDSGVLYQMQSGQRPERLGYEEFLSSMIGEDVILSYDPDEEDVYISDKDNAFIYTKSGGMCEISKKYTSITYVGSAAAGVFEDKSDNSLAIATDVLNFGAAGQKTITSVEVIGTVTSGDLAVSLDYTHSKVQSFTTTPTSNVNDEGIAYVRAGGREHRLLLTATDFTKVEIDDIIVKVQYDDKRNVRGLTGTERGQETK